MFVRCLSVRRRRLSVVSHHFQRAHAHLQETDPLFGQLNPYLNPESAFVLVRFWVILVQNEPKDLSDVGHVTQSLMVLSTNLLLI